MCSTRQERIAAFGRAIEEFASQARSEAVAAAAGPPTGKPVAAPPTRRPVAGDSIDPAADGRTVTAASAGPPAPGGSSRADAPATPDGAAATPSDVLSRLAELWVQLANLDPEVAKRLPTYEA